MLRGSFTPLAGVVLIKYKKEVITSNHCERYQPWLVQQAQKAHPFDMGRGERERIVLVIYLLLPSLTMEIGLSKWSCPYIRLDLVVGR